MEQVQKISRCVFLDAGHGGINPKTGQYMVLAGGKQFDHKKGSFHNGTIFYEGVFNRQLAQKIDAELVKKGIRVVHTYHDWQDNSLESRVALANKYSRTVKEGVFVSVHANAANTRARGFSVWTTKNKSKSDLLADFIWERVKVAMPEFQMREDRTDGDHDYEEQFYVTRNTEMPAVLIETLFFDNYEDAVLLMSQTIQQRVAVAVADAIADYLDRI